MERHRTNVEADFVYQVQTVGGFGGRSDQLNAYNVLTGDPGYGPTDRARYARMTPDAVAQTVDTFLNTAGRVALSVVPEGGTDAALPDSEPVHPR